MLMSQAEEAYTLMLQSTKDLLTRWRSRLVQTKLRLQRTNRSLKKLRRVLKKQQRGPTPKRDFTC